MKVKITAYGILKSYLGQGSVTAIDKEVNPAKSIREIISEMGIPDGMIMMIAVNDQQKDFNYVPQEGDDIKLIPPISGG